LHSGSLKMFRCLVATNGVSRKPEDSHAAVYTDSYSSCRAVNCLIVHNLGSGFYGSGNSHSFVNCAVIRNEHQGLYLWQKNAITNCIVFNNDLDGEQIWRGNGSMLSMAYSDVQGGVWSGPGNISENPVLCDDNFSLMQGCPCIDSGSPEVTFNDLCIDNTLCSPYSRGAARNDLGVYGGPLACGYGPGDTPAMVTQPRSQLSCPGQSVTLGMVRGVRLPSASSRGMGCVPVSLRYLASVARVCWTVVLTQPRMSCGQRPSRNMRPSAGTTSRRSRVVRSAKPRQRAGKGP
jgi:hypothetical protein